jgi:hypothetical protein
MTEFKRLAENVAAIVRGGAPAAAPDVFDSDALPYGVAPGNNKYGFETCPFCGKPPTETGLNYGPLAFLFRDELSAREYRISGLCQTCQDETFLPDSSIKGEA